MRICGNLEAGQSGMRWKAASEKMGYHSLAAKER